MTRGIQIVTLSTVIVLSGYGIAGAAAPGKAATGTAAPGMAATGAGATGAAATGKALPYDLNGDGYAETVVGSPGEALGEIGSTGMFHVLYGRATGATADGSVGIHQDTPGVPGMAEKKDNFGQVNTSGDFNGDGYADIAVSAPKENVGTAVDGGAVWIFYGSARGIRTDNVKTISIADTTLAEKGYVRFGYALTTGDFNRDGRDDLAIGTGSVSDGHVFIHYGTTGTGRRLVALSQDTPGVPGSGGIVGDFFGWAVAAGDVNHDGYADLAIGEPFDYEDTGYANGAVTVLYGGATGLTGQGAQRWTKNSPGVPGHGSDSEGEDGDREDWFGGTVALADLNGDGNADLVVGASGSDVAVDGAYRGDAGTVTVLYSDGTRIGTAQAVEVTRQTPGMPGDATEDDAFGRVLTTGDADGDGRWEIAINSRNDASVTVVPGGRHGLALRDAQTWTQESPEIPGDTEPDDAWGVALRFVDVRGTGQRSLIVGAVGEEGFQGAVTLIHSTSRGLTGDGAQLFTQDTPGVPGLGEWSDRFGTF